MKQTYLSGNLLDLKLWRLQRSSAVFVLVLVIVHLILQFIVFNSDAITFLEVSDRIKSGFILAVDVVLLISVSNLHHFLCYRCDHSVWVGCITRVYLRETTCQTLSPLKLL